MNRTVETQKLVFDIVKSLLPDSTVSISSDTPLIGDGSLLDSMRLVELCLLLEDKAFELGFEFDWTSDATMSRSRSMLRTAGALANEFVVQMDAKK